MTVLSPSGALPTLDTLFAITTPVAPPTVDFAAMLQTVTPVVAPMPLPQEAIAADESSIPVPGPVPLVLAAGEADAAGEAMRALSAVQLPIEAEPVPDAAGLIVPGDHMPATLFRRAPIMAPRLPDPVAGSGPAIAGAPETKGADAVAPDAPGLPEAGMMPTPPMEKAETMAVDAPIPAGPTPPPSEKMSMAPAAPPVERLIVADSAAIRPIVMPDRIEVPGPSLSDTRPPSPIAIPIGDKPQLAAFERAAPFAPQLMQIAQDVLSVAGERDVRFNVRPDLLGPVAVTIERTEAGANLRLGVESNQAVLAVRAAEPLLQDNGRAAPFVHVTVDLTAQDQRGRQPRPPVPTRRANGRVEDQERAPTGRFA